MDLFLLFGAWWDSCFSGSPSPSPWAFRLFFLMVSGQMEMLIMIPNRMVLALDSYGLMAIPFFYLRGRSCSSGN